MVDIPEKERKDYPNGKGGFYDKNIDTENSVIYDLFLEGMNNINEILKQQSKSK